MRSMMLVRRRAREIGRSSNARFVTAIAIAEPGRRPVLSHRALRRAAYEAANARWRVARRKRRRALQRRDRI